LVKGRALVESPTNSVHSGHAARDWALEQPIGGSAAVQRLRRARFALVSQ